MWFYAAENKTDKAGVQSRLRTALLLPLFKNIQYNIKVLLKKGKSIMKKFKIPITPHTTNKCIRFPDNIIEEVEESIRGLDCTFSAFVVEAVRVALENLAEEEEEK